MISIVDSFSFSLLLSHSPTTNARPHKSPSQIFIFLALLPALDCFKGLFGNSMGA